MPKLEPMGSSWNARRGARCAELQHDTFAAREFTTSSKKERRRTKKAARLTKKVEEETNKAARLLWSLLAFIGSFEHCEGASVALRPGSFGFFSSGRAGQEVAWPSATPKG